MKSWCTVSPTTICGEIFLFSVWSHEKLPSHWPTVSGKTESERTKILLSSSLRLLQTTWASANTEVTNGMAPWAQCWVQKNKKRWRKESTTAENLLENFCTFHSKSVSTKTELADWMAMWKWMFRWCAFRAEASSPTQRRTERKTVNIYITISTRKVEQRGMNILKFLLSKFGKTFIIRLQLNWGNPRALQHRQWLCLSLGYQYLHKHFRLTPQHKHPRNAWVKQQLTTNLLREPNEHSPDR